MKILPSLREKKRYLVFEVLSEDRVKDFRIIKSEILNNVHSFLGQVESGKAGAMFLKDLWFKEEQKGILSVNNKYVDKVKMSLMLIKKLENKDVILNNIGCSGILNKAKKYV